MTQHVMLDLETLGKGSYAAIWTIGAVKFNPWHCPETVQELLDTTEKFHVRVSDFGMQSRMMPDSDTINWWMQSKNDAARAANNRLDGASLFEVLDGFSKWYGNDKTLPVWGNGATFDNVIVTNAFGCCMMAKPWDYKSDRCFRTVKEMFPGVPHEEVGVAHGALDDALAQAWWLQRIVREKTLVNL